MNFFLRIFIIFILLFKSQPGFSQTGRDKVEALRRAYITEHVGLTPAEAEKFWPVYNEYTFKLKVVRRNLRKSYRKNEENLSEQEAEQLYVLFIQSKQAEADLHKQYNEKLRAVIGAKKVVKLHIAEEEFRIEVMKSIRGEND